MDRVYIRIPLKHVIAGDYKVGLTPRTLTNWWGAWIFPDGKVEELSRGKYHDNLAREWGFTDEFDAIEHGYIKVRVYKDVVAIEAPKLTSETRLHISDFLSTVGENHKITLNAAPRIDEQFTNPEEAINWLEYRTVFASKAADEPSIYQNGGWIGPDGKFHALAKFSAFHNELIQKLGLANSQEALAAGWIRISIFSTDYGVEIETLTDDVRSRIIDFLQGANPEKAVNLEWHKPKASHRYFWLVDAAIDSLENRRVYAAKNASKVKTAISLPTLVQETNTFSVKNRPGCSATLKKSDPKDLFLEYNVKCNLPDSDPSGHDVRVHFDVSKVQETEKAKDLDVRVSCACPAFLYWGGQWNLHQRDGLEGEPRPKLQAPTERLDLRSNFVICKHCKAVFERILPAVQNNINNILRKLQVKQYEEEVKEKGIKPPSIRRQPGQLSPEDKDVAQKLREGIEEREREKLLKDQGIVKRTPEVVTVAPKKPSEESLEELEPYLPEQEFEDLKKLEDSERKKLLESMPALPVEEPETGEIEEHPEKPHLHTGLPYERKEEPKWKQWVKKLKDRVKNWKGEEEKFPYRKFTNKRGKLDQSTIDWYVRYMSRMSYNSEQQARDELFRILEHHDKDTSAEVFGKNGPEKNRAIANEMPVYKDEDGKWKFGKQPEVSAIRIGQPNPEGDVPDVDFYKRDNQDTGGPITPESIRKTYGGSKSKAKVYPAWVHIADLPQEELVEEMPDEDEEPSTYPWEDFSIGHGVFPPAKLHVSPTGKVIISDGNHRIRWWKEKGYDMIPAWVIDERKGRLKKAWLLQGTV